MRHRSIVSRLAQVIRRQRRVILDAWTLERVGYSKSAPKLRRELERTQ